MDLNDGIVSAAGIAEGFAAAGASTRALVFAGATVVLTGGFAAAASCYAEERTDWEMHHRMVEAERASIEADPAGEFEELIAAYEAKGLETGLARQVAAALTARDPVAAHADAELDLESIAPARANVYAALSAGLFYGLGAAVPLLAIRWLPTRERSELAFVPVLLAQGRITPAARICREIPLRFGTARVTGPTREPLRCRNSCCFVFAAELRRACRGGAAAGSRREQPTDAGAQAGAGAKH